MDEDSGGARGSGHGPARPRATWTDRDLDDAPPALGPMLRRTGSVYRSIWVPALAVLGVATAALIGWLVLGMGLFDLAARGQRSLVLTADGRFKTSGLWVILLEIGLPLLVAIVATYLATLAALADLAAQADAGRPVRASRALRLAVRRVPSLLGATAMVVGGVVAFVALTPLFMIAGLLGLLATPVVWLVRRRAPEADRVAWWPTAGRLLVWCIPLGAAVRLACRWILVLPAVALETNGPRRALRRSSAAVAGRAWRVAAIIVGVYAAYFVVDQLVALVAGRLLSPLVGLVGRLVVQYVLASLPIAAVVVAFRAFAGPTDPERLPALPTRRPGAPTAVVHHTVLLVVFALLAGSGAAVLVGSAAVTAPAAQAAGAATYVVASLGDEPDATPGDGVCATAGAVCTLRAAVDEATAQPTQSTTITFGLDGTIVLASSLVLATSVHLDGTGHKVRLEPPRSCSDCPWDRVQLIRVPSPTTSYAITNLQLQHGGTTATAGGGALETAGTGVLRAVTFSENTSQLADGGAVSVTGGSLTGTNLTFWSNSAVNGFGGADIASAGAVSLVNVTAFGADGGSMLATGGTFSITNSLLGATAGATCTGAITGDTNLGSGSCAGFFSEVNGIGTFGDHGGPVDTIDLAGSSYAVDRGLAAPTCPATDARGVTRPQGSGCDLGAYEFTPASAPLALTVDDLGVGPDANPGDRVCATAAGRCTLPAAVDEANAEPGRPATVTFSVDGTITVGAPLVPVLSSFTLDGSGHHVTVSGNDTTAIFTMGSGTAYTLQALTLARGAAGASGGGAVDADATTTGTISGVTFDANSATGGTGGAVRNAGTLSVTNATFSANTASAGADLADSGTATVGSSTFVGATGGAISSSGPGLTLDNSIVAPASGAACTGAVSGTTDLSTDGSCPGATSATPGLAALADNGGDVRTVALAADSPAVDAATGAPCPAVDARGVSRPQLGACDIGAFEYRAPTTPTVFVVDDFGTTGDANPGDGACATATATCTLPAAADEANATTTALGNATPPFLVHFATDGTVVLTSPLAVHAPMTIDGESHKVVIDGADATQLLRFDAPNHPYRLAHLLLTRGRTSALDGGAAVQSSAPFGTIDGVTFSANANVASASTPGQAGGGAVAVTAGAVGLSNTTFSENSVDTALGGGGLYVRSKAVINNTTFASNVGGGLAAVGAAPDVTVTNSVFVSGSVGPNCAGPTSGSPNASDDITAQPCPGRISSGAVVGPLGDFGGPVPTVGLTPGSAAIDSGDDATCASTDARGVARPIGAHCDLGAFEFDPQVTVTLTATPNPAELTEPVTITASVASSTVPAVPTGTVTVTEGATVLGTISLVNGTGSLASSSSFPLGPHALTASYGGDASFPSASGATTLTVGPPTAAVAVAATPAAPMVGQPVVLSVTASQPRGTAVPTGTVHVREGATALGTATLSAGTAALPASMFAVGPHTITVDYAGDATFAATSGTTSFTVAVADTTVAVTSSAPSSRFGQPVTFSATVTPAFGGPTPTGSLTFADGATPLATVPLDAAGQAAATTGALAVAGHTITATYSGDPDHGGSVGSVTQTVTAASTSVAVASSSNPSVSGEAATLSATVTAVAPGAGVPGGSVSVFEGATLVGTAPLDAGGTAGVNLAGLPVGAHALTVAYSGDASFQASVGLITQTVQVAGTATALASSVNPSVAGQPVTFTATVTVVAPGSGTPTGSVTFLDGTTAIGSAPVDGTGVASLSIALPAGGTHTVTATYAGDTQRTGSTSAPLAQVVDAASTTTSVSSGSTSVAVGQPVTFTATVAVVAPGAGAPTGTVTFRDGTTVLGTAPLVLGGITTLTTPLRGPGTRPITATFNGTTSFAPSSGGVSQTVTQASTTVTVTSSLDPSVVSQTVTFTATVAAVAPGGGVPTGTVFFTDGATFLGGGTLDASGVATLSTSTLSTGTHAIVASFPGSADYAAADSAPYGQVVDSAGTGVTLTSDANPSVSGQPVTLSAAVAVVGGGAAPTGTVTFAEGATTLGAATLDGTGTATFVTAALGVGSHTITAAYGGDGSSLPATSPALTQVVDPAATTTAVTSQRNPSVVGASVTFDAKVTVVAPGAGAPTGSVQFRDGATVLGTATVDATGAASLTTTALAVGARPIRAVYLGSTTFAGSTSPVLTETVNPAATTTVLTSAPNPSVFGQAVTLTATVSVVAPGAVTPTGSVTFLDGTTTIGSAPVDATGVAALTTASLSVGARSLTAAYSPTPTTASSVSPAVTQTVALAATTTALTSSANPAVVNEPVTFTATVTATAPSTGTPTGSVTFADGATVLGTAPLDGTGRATLTTATLAVATHPVTASYASDGSFGASSSTATAQVVNRASTTTTVSTSISPSASGQTVTFTAAVATVAPGSGVPTGSVRFLDGATVLGTVALDGTGAGALSTSSLGVGSRSITVSYLGDPEHAPSTSAAITQVVTVASTSTAVVSSVNPSVSGQSVTLTATVSTTAPGSGTATGTVVFRDGATTIGSVPLDAAGQASVTLATLPVGARSITVTYAGDAARGASTSPALIQTVTLAATTTTLTSSVDPSVTGQPVTLRAAVALTAPGAGTATGTVTFLDGATTIGTGVLDGTGVATLVTTALGVGAHSLTAAFPGDPRAAASTSAVRSQTVDAAATTTTLVSSVDPSVVGQSVTFTATVTAVVPGGGTPTGAVTFTDGAATLGTVILVGGRASIATSSLTVGSHAVTASYAPAGPVAAHLPSTSSSLTQQVGVAGSVVVVSSSVEPSVTGQAVTLTATVTATGPGPTPTGAVTFLDGATTLGPATLVGGVATFTTSGLAPGSHALTASYAGDGVVGPGSSPVLTQTVDAAATTTQLGSVVASAVTGEPVTLTATVTVDAPGTGTPSSPVTFSDGATVLGSTVPVGGHATLVVTDLAIGPHDIAASYDGDAAYRPSTSATAQVTIDPAATATSVSSSANPSVVGAAVTYTATVAPVSPGAGTPTGTVNLFADFTLVGTTSTDAAGVATFTGVALPAGSHRLSADYLGSAAYASSSSTPFFQSVDAATPTVGLTASPSTVTYGNATGLAVQVTAPNGLVASGDVRIVVDGTPVRTVTLDAAGAVQTSVVVPPGAHTVVADYLGDLSLVPASSSPVPVNATAAATTVAFGTTPGSVSVVGQAVVVDATITTVGSPAAATGTLEVYDGATLVGTTTVTAGAASVPVTTLAVGARSLRAVFVPDPGFTTSSAGPVAFTVLPAATTTALAISPTPSVAGQPVALTATVTAVAPGGGVPIGTVAFTEGGSTIGAALVDGTGHATISVTTLAVGPHAITATYTSTGGYLGSSAGATTTVAQAATTMSIVADKASIVSGEPITFTVTVQPQAPGGGIPSGTVQVSSGPTASGTLDATGTTRITTTGTFAGRLSFQFAYLGDPAYAASSTSRLVTVDLAATATSLTVTPTAPVLGDRVDIVAHVTASAPSVGFPSGSVRLEDRGAFVARSTVQADGTATFTRFVPSSFAVGTHSLVAVFEQTAGYLGSSSPATAVVVDKAPVTLTLSTDPAASSVGQPFDLQARVGAANGARPAGSVAFYEGSRFIGSSPISDTIIGWGVSIPAPLDLAVGPHTFTAFYSGDPDYAATSATLTRTIDPTATATAVLGASSGYVGKNAAFTIVVRNTDIVPGLTPARPTGIVDVRVDGVIASQAILTPNPNPGWSQAPFTAFNLAAGPHQITATYRPDPNFAASTGTLTYTSLRYTAFLTVRAVSSTIVPWGTPAEFVADLTAPTVPGVDPPFGPITITDGTRSCVTYPSSPCALMWEIPGEHQITASFAGNDTYAPATGRGPLMSIVRRTPAITATVSDPTPYTQAPVTLNWAVSGPTGGTVRALFNSSLCAGNGLTGACSTTARLDQADTKVAGLASYLGDDLWAPAVATTSFTPVGCYPLTVYGGGTPAGTVQVSGQSRCPGGYLKGQVVTVTITPAEGMSIFDVYPGGSTAPVQRFAVGPDDGQTTVVSVSFNRVVECVTLTLATEKTNGGSGRFFADTDNAYGEPNCPVDAQGYGVNPRWDYSADGRQRTGRFLRNSAVTLTAVPDDLSGIYGRRATDSIVYGYRYGDDRSPLVQDPPGTITLVRDTYVQAVFGPVCYQVDAVVDPGTAGPDVASGMRARRDTPTNCADPTKGPGYLFGTTARFTAYGSVTATKAGGLVDRWSAPSFSPIGREVSVPGTPTTVQDGRDTVPANQVDVVVVRNDTLRAVVAQCRALRLDPIGSAKAKGIATVAGTPDCPSNPDLWRPGARVQVSASIDPKVGSFGTWGSDFFPDDEKPSLTVTMDKDRTLHPSFNTAGDCFQVSIGVALPAGAGTTRMNNIDGDQACPPGSLNRANRGTQTGKVAQNQYRFTATPTQGNPMVGFHLEGWFRHYQYTELWKDLYQRTEDIEGSTLDVPLTYGPVYVRPAFCVAVNPGVTLISPNGTRNTGLAPDDSEFVLASPAPNCPYASNAWLVGTTVTLGAMAPTEGYTFRGWGGDLSGSERTKTVLLDGSVPSIDAVAQYDVRCFTVTFNHPSDIDRYPDAPNCPDADPSENKYIGGSTIAMLAKVPDGKVWQNWTGDVVNKDSTDATNLTNVLQDSNVNMNYRDRTLNEKTKQAFEDLGNYMAVGLKKAVGLAAVALQAFLEGAPPLSITSLVGGVASLANLIARQFTGSDAFDAAKYTSYVAQTMDLLASPFTCTAAWAAHDNTPESSNALETPGALAGLYAKERVITASKQRDALANLESVEGGRTFTAVPTSGGGFVLVPGAAASLPPDASSLTKLSTNVGDAVESAKVKFAKFKVKKVGMAKMGGRAGALIELGMNITDMVKSGPGIGWEATAKDAWTGGGDVFTDCMDKAMPDYLPITHLDGSERTYTPDDDGF